MVGILKRINVIVLIAGVEKMKVRRCCDCGQILDENSTLEECKHCASREFYDSEY